MGGRIPGSEWLWRLAFKRLGVARRMVELILSPPPPVAVRDLASAWVDRYPGAYLWRARANEKLGDLRTAAADYAAAIDHDEAQAWAGLRRVADAMRTAGDWTGARSAFVAARGARPDDREVFERLIEVVLAQGDAVAAVELATVFAARSPRGLLWRGLAHEMLHDWAAAVEDFAAVATVEADAWTGLLRIGWAQMAAANWAVSQQAFAAANALRPDDPIAFSGWVAAQARTPIHCATENAAFDNLKELFGAARGRHDEESLRVLEEAGIRWPKLGTRLRAWRRESSPGILLCSLPKSGSVYVQTALARGLARPILQQGAGGFFPHQQLPMGALDQICRDGSIYMIHAEASQYNRIELSHRLGRMVVHVRDPRQAVVSWAHFIPDVIRKLDPVQGIHYGLPANFGELPFERQLDWQIEHFYPLFVDWIAGWVAASRDPSFKTKILFRTQEILRSDPQRYFRELLEFYDIPSDLFDAPEPPRAGTLNVRKAEAAEWRRIMSPAQIAKVEAGLPAELRETFAWTS